jgi:hypothetical protein
MMTYALVMAVTVAILVLIALVSGTGISRLGIAFFLLLVTATGYFAFFSNSPAYNRLNAAFYSLLSHPL